MTNDNHTSVTMYLSNTAAQLKLQHYNTYLKKKLITLEQQLPQIIEMTVNIHMNKTAVKI